jgi:hypothetical protein
MRLRPAMSANGGDLGLRLVVLLVVGVAVLGSLHGPAASAAGPGQYSAPSWFPLRHGSNGQPFKVSCIKTNCAGPYHGYWASDIVDPVNQAGAPVYAAGAGQVVVAVGSHSGCGPSGTPTNLVGIYHGNNETSWYVHLNTVSVSVGQWVDQNTQLGTVGAVGYTDPCPTNHLHFQVDSGNETSIHDANAIDPGNLSACHGDTLVQYSVDTWNASAPSSTTAYSDGTACGGGGFADGSFILAPNGDVFRMAGGAPIYVNSWDAFGGPQAVTDVTDGQLAALPQYPADGTFVVGNGNVYRIAGGAPIYVSSWSDVGGPQAAVTISQAAIDSAGAGGVWNHLRSYPADGTFVVGNGNVYRVVGGAPTYVSNWSTVGGPQSAVTISQSAIDSAGAGGVWNHLRTYPADGTFVAGSAGFVYRVAGGAPIYVSTWDAVGGPQAATTIDQAAVENAGAGDVWNHLRLYPADGTFVYIGTGAAYRVAGGAALWLSTWEVFGGVQPSVLIDKAAIDNAGGAVPWNHLAPRPRDGTVLQGLPSGSYWLVSGGCVQLTSASADAVSVNDATVSALGVCGPPQIAAFTPSAAGAGSSVVLSGSGFVGVSGVSLCFVSASFSVVSSSQISVVVPSGACDGRWRVSTAGGTGVSVGAFTVTSPAVSGFAPGSGVAGSSVVLSGSKFVGVTGVSLCFVPASFSVGSGSSITAVVPAGACDGRWRVTTAGGIGVSDGAFTVVPVPAVSGFSPGAGTPGSAVTITGSGFGGASAVSLCFVPASFVVVSTTQVTAQVPSGACAGRWRVTTGGGTAASAAAFGVLEVIDVSPAGATLGASVTLHGIGFSAASQVTLCMVAASFTVNSDSSISAQVPAGACDGFWRVTSPAGVAVSPWPFTVTNRPAVSGFSPGTGPPGSTVTISGSSLDGASEVSLCFVTTTFTVVSAGQLTAKVPAGACDGRWRVTTPVGTAVSDGAFTVTAAVPVLDGFTPGSGPVGSAVTIHGANFGGATTVSLCFVTATFTVDSPTQITAQVPAGACSGRWRIITPTGTGASDTAYTIS